MPTSLTKYSVILKVVIIGFLILLLMIPIFMIQGLVTERETRRNNAISEVGSKWGQEQTLIGPILSVPFSEGEIIKYAHFLPASLSIKGEVEPQSLKRGIFEFVAYTSGLNFTGEFSAPNFSSLGISSNQLQVDKALITFGITDTRGINEEIKFNWNDQEFILKPTRDIKINGIDSSVGASVPLTIGQKYSYSTDIKLKGIQNLNFVPLGSETNIELTSGWGNPSFSGAFLPDEREVTADGFSAKWKVLDLNRNFPQQWIGNQINLVDSSIGVRLLVPVNEYRKTDRSIKYALLPIALTFLIFFFVEILRRIRIHPIQYTLVGLALVLFFSLLLSLSEHINFNLAYLIASLATILLITLYMKHAFKNNRVTQLLGFILAVVYVFIFITLQLQDLALLIGSVGLFMTLAIVMFVSRKVDWYTIGQKDVLNGSQSTTEKN